MTSTKQLGSKLGIAERYRYDQQRRVWRADGNDSFAYSDGDDNENYLLGVVSNAQDLTVGSRELFEAIRDWPSEYHLSPTRTNLIEPFDLSQIASVLEIGAGCGAITRRFAELGLDVTAVEGSLRRATIAAARCRDRSNVKVVNDAFQNFSSDSTHDLVTLIGVLEYAQLFSTAANPFLDLLERCREKLSRRGTLLIAIENQLGLKYLNGHLEDHTGRPFTGVCDLYSDKGVRTFGKDVITNLLYSAGFSRVSFFYPFPDYKLPQILVSQRGVEDTDFRVGQLLHRSASRSYFGTPKNAFDESLVWPVLDDNRLIPHLANSFLILASVSHDSIPLHDGWLAQYFTGRPSGALNTVTTFSRDRGAIVVNKGYRTSLSISKPVDLRTPSVKHLLSTATYVPGQQFDIELRKILARGGGLEEIGRWCAEWIQFLLDNSVQVTDAEPVALLPPHFVDCTPFNLVRNEMGTLEYIDREWALPDPIPMSWVVIRGLVYTIAQLDLARLFLRQTHYQAVYTIAAAGGWPLGERDFTEAIKLERILVEFLLSSSAETTGSLAIEEILNREIVQNAQIVDTNLVPLIPAEASRGKEQTKLDAREDEVCLTQTLTQLKESMSELEESNDILRRNVDVLGRRVGQVKSRLSGSKKQLEAIRASTAISLRDIPPHDSETSQEPRKTTCGVATRTLRKVRTASRLPVWFLKGNARDRLRIEREMRLIRDSKLFDEESYVVQCPAVKALGYDPIEHYCVSGWREGLNPQRLFSTNYYLNSNPDVRSQGVNPFVHYITHGAGEGRRPHTLFDPAHYESQLGSERENFQRSDALFHYQTVGRKRNLSPVQLFDPQFYIRTNPDLLSFEGDLFEHYTTFGDKEGRSPHVLFNVKYYRSKYAAQIGAAQTCLEHYLSSGTANLSPHPLFDPEFFRSQCRWQLDSDTPLLLQYMRIAKGVRVKPHPLFDPVYYLARYSDLKNLRMDPLVHYLCHGASEGRSPCPVFDAEYYLDQVAPENYESIGDPLSDYISVEAHYGVSPHPLFDSAYYLDQNPDVRSGRINPLVHYVAWGHSEGRNPHPLICERYYKKRYLNDARSSIPSIVHYVERKKSDDVSTPSLLFDPAYYRERYKSILTNVSDLFLHFLEFGRELELSPHPLFDTKYYIAKVRDRDRKTNPLVHYERGGFKVVPVPNEKGELTNRAASTNVKGSLSPLHAFLLKQSGFFGEASNATPLDRPVVQLKVLAGGQRVCSGPTIFVLMHLFPVPSRAGNEYRITRMIRWLSNVGFDVVPIIAPLGDELLDEVRERQLREAFGRFIVCYRDGRIYCSSHDEELLRELDGTEVEPSDPRLDGDIDPESTPLSREILNRDKRFCHSVLIRVVDHLASVSFPHAVIANYVYMTRVLSILPQGVIKIVDTHDVFSTKRAKVETYGIDDGLYIPPQDEALRLQRADTIIAIQDGEGEILRTLAPERRVITVGVDFDTEPTGSPSTTPTVLYLGSDNALNMAGLRDFVRLAWPIITKRVPSARLIVAGKVCKAIDSIDPSIELRGPVDDLAQLYGESWLVVNPAVAGTGLKIKTVEALSSGRRVVTWPNGADGLSPEVRGMCDLCADWFEFADTVADHLGGVPPVPSAQESARLLQSFSADRVYAQLRQVLLERPISTARSLTHQVESH